MENTDLMYKNVVLVVGESSDDALIGDIRKYLLEKYSLQTDIVQVAELEEPQEGIIYLLYLCDQKIKEFYIKILFRSVDLAILPNDRCPIAMRSYGISSDIFKAIDDVFNETEAVSVDLLKCNGDSILGNIIIGDVRGMNRAHDSAEGYLNRIISFFSGLKQLSFQEYTISTQKDNVTNTAATGILIFGHNVGGISHNFLNENLSLHDGRLHALILAPTSIVSYLYYLFFSNFFSKIVTEKLPKSVGLIASTSMEITSPSPINYLADGELKSDTKLTLETIPNALKIHLGRHIKDIPSDNKDITDEKETVRVQGLPNGERIILLVSEAIPFFSRASEEDFKDLFIGLKQNSKFSSVFMILLVLSTMLATTGLFQNSVPVIIGAMILAPLMSPIISFSMGVARGEKELLQESSITLLLGIITVLAFSSLYTYILPLNLITDEMSGRLNPNILDLMVAVISGIAGAYAYAKSEVAKSLAGVAIAVALLPPLSVTGIGIGWGNIEIVYGSFLLFLTNLAGITLSSSLTFLILGFAPVKRATKGIVFTTLFLIIITIPLFVSFNKVIEQHSTFRHLKHIEHITIDEHAVDIRVVSVDLSREMPTIYIETRSTTILEAEHFKKIKEKMDSIVKKPFVLNILSEVEVKE